MAEKRSLSELMEVSVLIMLKCFLADCNVMSIYEGESLNRSQRETAVMDLIGFLCISLGSSSVQLHDSLGSRCACSCSEAGFSSQNGDHA
jgi:hypothetical protein